MADRLQVESPFGINTGFFQPSIADFPARVRLIQEAGIKWGRQDYIWSDIERRKGQYDWSWNDRVADECTNHGVLLFGNLAYNPPFHDPCTPEGVEAYCRFAREAVARHRGKVDYWQIWNEPNGGFWKGTPEEYARLLSAAGRIIHATNPQAKVLGLNMAFCDVLWAERILKLVPYDCFDIVDYHPYRIPCTPEEHFDQWELDQYVRVWHKGELNADYPLVHMNMYEQAQTLRGLLSRFGEPKPLWVCEICWNAPFGAYGSSELRQAAVLVRAYVCLVALGKVDKIFWYQLVDEGTVQTNGGMMMGLVRADLVQKYAYYAYAWMSRILHDSVWVRNEIAGPETFATVFRRGQQEVMVGWTVSSMGYLRVNNERGLDFYDLFGVRRSVSSSNPLSEVTVPVDTQPIYIVGPTGLRARAVPSPGGSA